MINKSISFLRLYIKLLNEDNKEDDLKHFIWVNK